jgi:hypothetical protein
MTIDVERLVSGIHEYIGRALTPLVERIKTLESRITELESGAMPKDIADRARAKFAAQRLGAE